MTLTNEQAEDMRRQLSEHYHEPVMTLTKFCATMRKWADCVRQGVREKPEGGRGGGDSHYQHGEAYAPHIDHILTDIAKSALLGRLFYLGQEPRTTKCPEHNGHWSGIEWEDPERGQGNVCSHGCGLTGWLPNEPP